MPTDKEQIYDLDNIVCLPESSDEHSKLVLGFISDIVGPVSMPLYSVAIYKQCKEKLKDLDLKEFMKGKEVCLVQKCLKTINA